MEVLHLADALMEHFPKLIALSSKLTEERIFLFVTLLILANVPIFFRVIFHQGAWYQRSSTK